MIETAKTDTGSSRSKRYSMSPEELKAEIQRKGWTFRRLSLRWQVTEGWVSKVVRDANRAAHWDDAIRGIPLLTGNKSKSEREAPERLSVETCKDYLKNKHWSYRELALHWGKTEGWVSKIVRNTSRAKHWDDAIVGLPMRQTPGKKR